MAGLYEVLFGANTPSTSTMTDDQANAHWKREEDNYHSQIGLFNLLKQDPVAAFGYEKRRDPVMKTLNMGGDPGEGKFGLYQWRGKDDPGLLDVRVGLNPQHYGAILAHELGHTGSRHVDKNPQNMNMADEERRQRLTDVMVNYPTSKAHHDSVFMLTNDEELVGSKKLQAKVRKLMLEKQARAKRALDKNNKEKQS